MSFSQAVSGLNAASAGLDSIGNNIANSATNGFKGAHASFADMFAGSGVGLGVNVAAVSQSFKDGAITRTDRATDVAISGNGFFRLLDTNGDVVYSRDGEFHRDKSGNLVNNQGMMVSGFKAGVDANGKAVIQTGGAPEGISIPTDMMDAKLSTKVDLTLNLNSNDKAIDPTKNPFKEEDPDSFNFMTQIQSYDTQGNIHQISVYFIKTADNKWDVKARDTSDPTVTGASDLGKMEFDSNGKFDVTKSTPKEFKLEVKGINGAAGGDLVFALDKTRQQKVNESSVSKADVDGYQSGEYTSFKIENNGTITATYSNQQTRVVGMIALTSFANPNGLASQGGNVWKGTNASGTPMDGVPGTGQFGKITGGALEASNVDMSQELINMIVMQRNYQSNSQTIKTQDQMLQTLVNLR